MLLNRRFHASTPTVFPFPAMQLRVAIQSEFNSRHLQLTELCRNPIQLNCNCLPINCIACELNCNSQSTQLAASAYRLNTGIVPLARSPPLTHPLRSSLCPL